MSSQKSEEMADVKKRWEEKSNVMAGGGRIVWLVQVIFDTPQTAAYYFTPRESVTRATGEVHFEVDTSLFFFALETAIVKTWRLTATVLKTLKFIYLGPHQLLARLDYFAQHRLLERKS